MPTATADRSRQLVAALGWTGLVTLALLVPVPAGWTGPDFGLELFSFDKLMHLAVFALLVWLWRRWDAAATPGARRLSMLALVVAAAAYGGVLELLQGPVGRDPSWGDAIADLAGALVGLVPATRRPPL